MKFEDSLFKRKKGKKQKPVQDLFVIRGRFFFFGVGQNIFIRVRKKLYSWGITHESWGQNIL